LSIGSIVTMPLASIPPEYGTWKIGGSATYYYLGDTPAAFTNNGDHSTAVVAATLSTAF
jgi:hypothetical protein